MQYCVAIDSPIILTWLCWQGGHIPTFVCICWNFEWYQIHTKLTFATIQSLCHGVHIIPGYGNVSYTASADLYLILVKSLAPGKFEWNFIHVIFKQILVIDGWGICCEIALIWMSLDFTDDQSTLVQVMAWCGQATSHYLSQCWPRSLSPYGLTRPQWVNQMYFNSIWPSDAIWHHRAWSTLVQVMACCLTAPSHYLNQCWLIISEVLWHSFQGNFTGNAQDTNPWCELENY